MGYELHIVRNDEWWDDDAGGGISFDEWSFLMDADDSMRMDGFAEVTSPDGRRLRVESEGMAVWTGYPANIDGGNRAWFDFRDGRIVIKNPDQEILGKMLEIAGALNAKVVGDEGEQYNSPTDHGVPKRSSNPQDDARHAKSWWRFW